jgi:acetyl-CoA carboxylase biotin carboxyl carrier protein
VSLTPEDVQSLIAAFEASEWDEMTLAVDGTQLALSRSGRPPAAAAAPAAPPSTAPETVAVGQSGAAAAAIGGSRGTGGAAPPAPPSPDTTATLGGGTAEGALRITAPSVGLFWRSPQPGAPHFVDVGQTVGPDDTVCIVEVMKLMNHIKAGIAGVVRSVEVENGAMVEHGQVLFVLDPAS